MNTPFSTRKRPAPPAEGPAADLTEAERELKQQIADAERRMEEACLALGKAYLERHRDDFEPAFAGWMQAIRKAEEDRQAYKKQWLFLKGIVICAHCGAEVPKDARYCGVCGQRIADSAPEVPGGF